MTINELKKRRAKGKEIMDRRLKKRGEPLGDGSGRGIRANRGRGGCAPREWPLRGRGRI